MGEIQFTPKSLPTLLGLNATQVWDTELAFSHLQALGQADSKRTAERRLNEIGLLPQALTIEGLRDEHDRSPNRPVLEWAVKEARKRRDRVLFVQLQSMPGGQPCLHANDARGARLWVPLTNLSDATIQRALTDLQSYLDKPIAVFPHGSLVAHLRSFPSIENIQLSAYAYRPIPPQGLGVRGNNKSHWMSSAHLKQLEAESIYILREALAEAQNPVMMYSIGKDSSVMLRLARKAFYPKPPPFPLLHIDTRWKFQEIYMFRDFIARKSGIDLLVHTNPEAIEKNINPFDHGSALHTNITKTDGIKQALDHYKFDVVFVGSRRDEDKSIAKERIASHRTSNHRWDVNHQRPEVWNLYNTSKNPGESIRIYPLANWTELDIWQYICQEDIPVVPLYFAKPRPVLVRSDMIMLVDDERCRLLPGEEVQIKKVRFRSLGCYPLTGAVESEAETPEDVLLEILCARQSERRGRKIDVDSPDAMEKRRQEGYF